MRGNQPSLTLGPKQPDSAAVTEAAGVASGAKAQTVHLPGVDSKGRAVAGAFGRALAGDGAPEGGRKPKRVSVCSTSKNHCYTENEKIEKLETIGFLMVHI